MLILLIGPSSSQCKGIQRAKFPIHKTFIAMTRSCHAGSAR
jgi:hypothetical protein